MTSHEASSRLRDAPYVYLRYEDGGLPPTLEEVEQQFHDLRCLLHFAAWDDVFVNANLSSLAQGLRARTRAGSSPEQTVGLSVAADVRMLSIVRRISLTSPLRVLLENPAITVSSFSAAV